jgi:hypothetical protein
VGQQLSEAIEKGSDLLFRTHNAIRVKVAMPGNSDDEGCEVLWRKAGQKTSASIDGRAPLWGYATSRDNPLSSVHAQRRTHERGRKLNSERRSSYPPTGAAHGCAAAKNPYTPTVHAPAAAVAAPLWPKG